MIQPASNTSHFRARYRIQPQLQKGFAAVRTLEKKWDQEATIAQKDLDDRVNLRLNALERRADNFEAAMKVGVFVAVVTGSGVAAYQNWDAIQGAETRAFANLPSGDAIRNGFSQRWNDLKAYFA